MARRPPVDQSDPQAISSPDECSTVDRIIRISTQITGPQISNPNSKSYQNSNKFIATEHMRNCNSFLPNKALLPMIGET